MTLPPKVQQVLDEMRNHMKDVLKMTAVGKQTMAAWADRLQSALEEIQQQACGQRDGWQLVPKEPSKRMVIAGFESDAFERVDEVKTCRDAAECVKEIYKAMIAASPDVPDETMDRTKPKD